MNYVILENYVILDNFLETVDFENLAERVPTAPSARVARASPSLGLWPTYYASRPSASSTREL